jgi:hypothetical protein
VNELLEASLRFPTVIFTIGLGISMVYWLFVLLGALDIDLFGDGHDGGGHGDGDGHDADGGIMKTLGLATVPLTISVSVIFLVCWVGSLLAMHHLAGPLGVLAGWLPAVVLLAVIVIGIPLAGQLVRPLGPVFELKEGKSNRDYVGHFCTITTGKVDDGFGQATVEDGGTVLVIPVRCDKSGALGRGHKALIIDFDTAREAYVVEPTTDLMARMGEE